MGRPLKSSSTSSSDRAVVIFSSIVLSLFTLGLVASIWNLPTPKTYRPDLLSFHKSINLGVSGIDDVGDDDDINNSAKDLDDELKLLHEEGMTIRDLGNNLGNSNLHAHKEHNTLIPQAKWPISIRDEDGDFEDVVHPGHRAKNHTDVIMAVPKMWIDDPLSIHQNKLMTRELAMKIGSCTVPDASGNFARGDSCPLDERTIYVAIASYRDYQCRDTVTSIFERAKHPDRIRVGVIDQIMDGEDIHCDAPHEPCSENPEQMLCKYKNQLDILQVDPLLAVGPVFARHLGHRLYRGEYYYMQSDAHVTYANNWDLDIISQQEATKNEMAVLSTYLSNVEGALDEKGDSIKKGRPIMCDTGFEEGQHNKHLRHGTQPESAPSITGMPQLHPFWSAGFSFSRGHFVVNVPYDFYQPLIFQGEEISIAVRGFSIGYDFYAPEKSVCFHHYAEGKNSENVAKREKVPKFYDHNRVYAGAGIRSMSRMLAIIHMSPAMDPSKWDHTDEEKYGIGNVEFRSPEHFYEVFGIDVKNKSNEGHLCDFVDTGDMHKLFTQYLRADGMGLDYSKIVYKFTDPRPGETDDDETDDTEG
ncbi:glycosyltransferase (GlcNAc) [Skeletonema marinoi]|uniref:Glycosyltransferase (GlcNAc) n=1 Tax=Skeletonema marinoi TaxID=267567 RepID=A0AAD8YEP5_9STRA|nr:glycosyltransferase (GlcNAc) [Skeletonema marinoi]